MKILYGKFFLFLVCLLLIVSCGSRKKIAYLQDIGNSGEAGSAVSFEPVLQPDDLLSIIVSAETPEVTVPFNMPAIQGNYEVNNNQNGIKTYLIDNTGNIDFPVIGKIKLGGLTRSQAISKLVQAVAEYVNNPGINLRILNFKVSVLGEVIKPGTFTIQSERITLLEALSMSGDLTIYGKRDNILVIREAEGKKSYNRVDITKSDFINSPFYYLTQNDIIVVEPNQTRVNASIIGPNISVAISALSLLLTVIVLISRN
ncbi:MAG TPA: polysaccharide biosynthesis/export family protein [Flavobacterium sp.]|jgi:polysaccharide export outer membrane protein